MKKTAQIFEQDCTQNDKNIISPTYIRRWIKKEMKTLPPESLGTFFEEARHSGVFELYYLDLATGLRRGELLGLKWSDIDLSKGIICVRRQILRQNGKVVEAPLKTKNSYRSIAIGADTIEVLKSMNS